MERSRNKTIERIAVLKRIRTNSSSRKPPRFVKEKSCERDNLMRDFEVSKERKKQYIRNWLYSLPEYRMLWSSFFVTLVAKFF